MILLLISVVVRLAVKNGKTDRVIITYGGKKEIYELQDKPVTVTVDQGDHKINKIHISKKEIYMLESTCKNQLCVHQGKMTPGNIKNRLMGRYIICLPHELTIELETEEEADK